MMEKTTTAYRLPEIELILVLSIARFTVRAREVQQAEWK